MATGGSDSTDGVKPSVHSRGPSTGRAETNMRRLQSAYEYAISRAMWSNVKRSLLRTVIQRHHALPGLSFTSSTARIRGRVYQTEISGRSEGFNFTTIDAVSMVPTCKTVRKAVVHTRRQRTSHANMHPRTSPFRFRAGAGNRLRSRDRRRGSGCWTRTW